MYREKIESYFKDKMPELISAASRLIAIDSTEGAPEPGKPFGAGPARALEEALKIAEEYGLRAESAEGYVAVADLNDRETRLHMLTHLDVVDAGTGWTVTGPFVPKVANGLLYGRGADDDKGPTAAALLAMRAVKELGIPLKYNCRLIMGTNEESGFGDIIHYFSSHPYAPYTFSPDAGFPLINIEKGHYRPLFSRTWPAETALPRVTSVSGGQRLNVVPAGASAELMGLSAAQVLPYSAKAEAETGVRFTLKERDGGVSILASGVSGHVAEPEKAVNALTALLHLLASLPLAPCGSTGAVRALQELFPHGDHLGAALGIAQRDELSGPLTVSFTMLALNGTGFEGRFDSRSALTATEQSCRKRAEAALGGYGIEVTGFPEMHAGHHTPASSPFVKTLLSCYEEYTGMPGECIAIGGGTYVHDIPGGVAFGCSMPGFVTNLHSQDEHASLSDLLTSAKIFAEAIGRICG